MKKTITLLCSMVLACLLSFNAKAQYSKGDVTASVGFSLGVRGAYGHGYGFSDNYSGFLPVTANLEYNVSDVFAIGAYGGYYGRSYRYSNYNYKDRFSITTFGARGTFHGTGLINKALDVNIPEQKWDLYGTLLLGYETYRVTWGDDRFRQEGYSAGGFVPGLVFGTRYFFTPKFGAFLELGRGTYGAASIGISGKF
jgi:hypothetical protein